MHRIDVPTAAQTPPPKQEPGTPGYFTSGNFVAGVKATIPGADWFNTVQAELSNTVEATGQALDRDDDAQLLQAIRTLINRARYRPGQIVISAGEPLEGTLLCDGSELARDRYPELFAVIGTKYGAGDGSSTFNLPLCKEGTTITHTNSAGLVGKHSSGEVVGHTHAASAQAGGAHGHTISIGAAGSHAHSASANAVGDHVHGAWTDAQGHHSHGGTASWVGDHQHTVPYGEDGSFPWGFDGGSNKRGSGRSDYDNNWPYTSPSGNHSHTIATDAGGNHSHNIGMNGAGGHSHTISVAAVGDHTHTASIDNAGDHQHAVTVSSTGGTDNLPAGLRMMYCIAY